MSNLTKFEFVALDISGKNYLSWILDAEIHLTFLNLGETIKKGNEESQQDRAKALIDLGLHHHNLANVLTLYTQVRATVSFKCHDA